MKYLVALAALVAASSALADQRIHQAPSVPIECKSVQPPSGYCVKGPTYYKLDGAIVRWIIDKTDPVENPEFWREQDKDHFGSDVSTGGGGDAGASK